jgi:protein phosphatase PTC7
MAAFATLESASRNLWTRSTVSRTDGVLRRRSTRSTLARLSSLPHGSGATEHRPHPKWLVNRRKVNRQTWSSAWQAFSSAAQPTDSDDVNLSKDSESALKTPIDFSKEDEHVEERKRKRLSEVRISEVLQAKHSYRWVDPVIPRTATVQEAIVTTIEGGLSGAMVLEDESHNRVCGLITSRDLLRIMASGVKEGDTPEEIMNRLVGDYMTPISQVVYGRPDETVGMCRTIMARLGIKCLPILSREGRVEGLVTARDMSDFGLSAKDRGGKKSYLNDVSERVGLSSNTSMAEPPIYLKAQLALGPTPLFINVGVAELPHPFKTADGGLVQGMRDLGFNDLSTDPTLSEDSCFVTNVKLPDGKKKTLRDFTYMGVADGVGSWREYGVDPRLFARRLMEECENILLEAQRNGQMDGNNFRQVTAPSDIMAQAFERVKAENVIGSSTACIGVFDQIRHQLHFSNLGDSGIIVLRHIDSDVAGSLKRDRVTPRTERTSDIRVAFVSQQQLKSFNHPFQIGWTGEELKEGESSSFRNAGESCTSSIHLRRGDVVIMATDGLFDNVELDDICTMVLEWEQQNGFVRAGDTQAREKRWQMGNSLTLLSAGRINDLAQRLVKKARENSLDSSLDSPFAILAKENDIMWSGGMPDDCIVIAMHVVGRDANDTMDSTKM